MAELLLISDDLIRTARLARDISQFEASTIYDLYDDKAFPKLPEAIVSDVKTLSSDAVQRLRQVLERVRGRHVPHLCLFHDNGIRAHAYADVLGASSLLSAFSDPQVLVSTLTELRERAAPVLATAQRHVDAAERFLRETFVPGRVLTPAEIEAGTEVVATAVMEADIRCWVRAVRRFDDATHQHCMLVSGLSAAFGSVLGFSATDRHHLVKAALLHDVGKMEIDRAILHKPGKLDDAEMAVMRTHAVRGHAMLIGRGFDDTLLAVVRSHHEMLDGSGYPDKLVGRQIPDLVRLVTICDIFGALIERRPYRAPMSSVRAYEILVGMGGKLDAALVRAFEPVAKAF